MINIDNFVISFNSTHHAIKSEQELKDRDIKIRMIPTPREITASCGLSIKFPEEDLDEVKKIINNLIKEDLISIRGIYRVIRNEKEQSLTELS